MMIRKAKTTDVEACLMLARQEGERYWTKKDFRDSVKDKDVELFVAVEKGRIVGYSAGFITPTKRNEELMHETRVYKGHRGKYIGTELVKSVSEALFKRKVKVIYAMIEPGLKPFYIKSCGFKETGRWIEASKRR